MILADVKMIIAWLHVHPHLAGLVTFCIAAAESIAVLGLLVPGSVFMTGIGTLIGAGVLPFTTTLFWAISGAIVGDGVSYWLGHHYHERIRTLWPFRRFSKFLAKGEDFFKKHGAKSVMLGRFVGPVRPIVPLIAGMMNMLPRKFIIANVCSGILWAPLYLTPGILIGATAMELPPGQATQFLIIMVGLLLLLWLLGWLVRHILVRIWYVFDRWLGQAWQSLREQHKMQRFINFIQNPEHPEKGHHQFTILVAGVFCLIVFILIALSVLNDGMVTTFNFSIFHLMRSFYSEKVQDVVALFTLAGEPIVLIPLLFTVTAWFFFRRHWRAACHWFLVVGFSFFCVFLFKHLIESPRPPGLLNPLNTSSFPSGHVLLVLTIYGYLSTLIAFQLKREQRWILYLVTGLFTVLIGLSRLYLSAHWLSDVVGSLFLGLSLVFLGTVSYRRRSAPPFAIKGVLSVVVLTFVLSYGFFFLVLHQKEEQKYTPYWPRYTLTYQNWWYHQDTAIPSAYRTSHFGKPLEPINLQWASPLGTIHDALIAQGWQAQSKFDLSEALKHFSWHKNTELLPLFPHLYRDRPPVLTLTLTQNDHILILRLWNAYTYFTDTEIPLWYGVLDAQSLKKQPLLHHHTETIVMPDVLSQLTPFLKPFQFQWVAAVPDQTNAAPALENNKMLIIGPRSA